MTAYIHILFSYGVLLELIPKNITILPELELAPRITALLS